MILYCDKCHCLLQNENTELLFCPKCKYKVRIYKKKEVK